jgi:CMP-N-acetylneuraminic acid synthetase
MKITAIVPIKKDSERVPGKNHRLLNGKPLYTIILDTLQACNTIEHIIVNTDCADMGNKIALAYNKAIVIERPVHLLGNHISANQLIANDIDKGKSDHFLQTHCTNPLLTQKTITGAINQYFNTLSAHDSLLSVSPIRARLYNNNKTPYNHKAGEMLRTQDMDVVYKENSSFFIFSRQSFLKAGNNRVGLTPAVFEMSEIESVDIDYENDFLLAELIDKNRNLFPDIFGSQAK